MPAFVDTIVNLTGIKHSEDLNGGEPNCVSITPLVSGVDASGTSNDNRGCPLYETEHRLA